eukprot:9478749-Pyramimonas_sp.AAC.1
MRCSPFMTHDRLLHVQQTGCSQMLASGLLSHGPAKASYLCSAQGARRCSWMGCSPLGPFANLTSAEHRVPVDYGGWGALPCTHERFPHVPRTGCRWMGCSHLDPWAVPICVARRIFAHAPGWGVLPWTHNRFQPVHRTGCSRMLVDGLFPQGPRAIPTCPFSASGGRACLWMGCSPKCP